MKFQLLFVFATFFLAVNAVPARKSFFLASAKDFGATLVRVPVAPRGGCTQGGGPTLAPSTTTKAPSTTTSALGTTSSFGTTFSLGTTTTALGTTTIAPETTTTSTDGDTVPSAGAPPSGTGSCVSCSVDNFNLVNDYRASRGLSGVGWSDTLANLAEGWSKRMFDTEVFEHSDYPYWENIAYAYNRHTWATAAEGFFEGWRNSPGHDENMRLPTHQCMGVGIYGDGTLMYATQIFSNDCP